MRYVPYEDLGETPSVIVDGAATQSTVLTLSHWPKSGSPAWATAALVRHLDELEGAERWKFDGVQQLTPSLRLVDAADSNIEPDEFVRLVTTALRAGPAAWDPYD